MIGREILWIAALVVAGSSSPVLAKDALVLEPSSRWELDYAADSCALRRMFGEGAQQSQLEIRRFQPGLSLQTTVATRAMPMTRRNFRYRFDPNPEWQDAAAANYVYFGDNFEGVIFYPQLPDLVVDKKKDDDELRQDFTTADLVAMEAKAAQGIESITMSRAFRDDLVLKTGSLGAPLIALNACIDELLGHWGIDVEAHKTLTRPAIAKNVSKMGRLIPYPPKMLAQRLPGIVNVRLEVGETGAVNGCHIQMELSDPAFEEASCKTLQKSLKFDPALDKDGKPIASYWINRVRFNP